ncbi:MAG TPA: SIMPL domain-containing protein [Caulobacterales bacterium]|nr:SIMPL domain-containing protein [Caulobacterales bacterium]
MRIFAILVALAVLTAPAAAQEPSRATVLNVNAMGEVSARPDMATIQLGVRTTGATAQAAMADNAAAMSALTRALRQAGLAERDIQTAYMSVNPRYRGQDNQTIDQYVATNTVRAVVRDIDSVGAIIDRAAVAGANTVSGISFGLQNPEPQINQARLEAVTDARERAELYARALGMHVERIISITEAGAAAPSFNDEIIVTASRRSGGSYTTPVSPGELISRANVSVSFELR